MEMPQHARYWINIHAMIDARLSRFKASDDDVHFIRCVVFSYKNKYYFITSRNVVVFKNIFLHKCGEAKKDRLVSHCVCHCAKGQRT
jgi:hypothetical protein